MQQTFKFYMCINLNKNLQSYITSFNASSREDLLLESSFTSDEEQKKWNFKFYLDLYEVK